jgi:hypothetical protein
MSNMITRYEGHIYRLLVKSEGGFQRYRDITC